MRILLLLSASFLIFSAPALAQKKKDRKNNSGGQYDAWTPGQTPNTLSPNTQAAPRQPEKSKKSKQSSGMFAKKTLSPEQDFRKRMEAVAAQRRKAEKEMQKPQYSDPMYFGHKKKPKKRPVGKRKFCQECGIVH
jgi:hypothetical protein